MRPLGVAAPRWSRAGDGGGAAATATVFTKLFAYDLAAPSQLLRKWLISSQLDRKLQPLRVGVVADPSGKTVGGVTLQG
jgi:hypothetical protein